jgi:uncharacterized protein GlcG (DUF336 family)
VKTEASSGALIPTPKVIPKSPMCSPKRIAPSQLLWPKARELTAAISVSVCDAYGHLVAHQRMDNVFMDAIRESIGQSRCGSRISFAQRRKVKRRCLSPLTGMVVASGVPDIRSRGGLPVIRGGKLAGAIGVSGTQTDEQDEECARAGVEALIKDE